MIQRLSDLKTNEKAYIKKIETDKELKNRLYSFGVIAGETIKVGKISLDKQTLEIIVENTSIAIRLSEAKTIFIEKVI